MVLLRSLQQVVLDLGEGLLQALVLLDNLVVVSDVRLVYCDRNLVFETGLRAQAALAGRSDALPRLPVGLPDNVVAHVEDLGVVTVEGSQIAALLGLALAAASDRTRTSVTRIFGKGLARGLGRSILSPPL